MGNTLFERWNDGEKLNLNAFTICLFKAFIEADGNNRGKMVKEWPEWFPLNW